MHHFSMASIVSLGEESTGFEWLLLEAVARDHRLIASGFAEGRPGQGTLSPSMKSVKTDGGYLVSGAKKPCSLSRSMDILTASIAVEGEHGEPVMGVALIPAESPGIEIMPFWNSWVLAGAESEAVVLEDVFVHDDLIVKTSVGFGHQLDRITLLSFLWFEAVITAGYLGAASALAERVFANNRVLNGEKMRLLVEIESAAQLLEGMARAQAEIEPDPEAFARCLLGRYAAQDAIIRATAMAVEMLGGMAFIGGPEVVDLAAWPRPTPPGCTRRTARRLRRHLRRLRPGRRDPGLLRPPRSGAAAPLRIRPGSAAPRPPVRHRSTPHE